MSISRKIKIIGDTPGHNERFYCLLCNFNVFREINKPTRKEIAEFGSGHPSALSSISLYEENGGIFDLIDNQDIPGYVDTLSTSEGNINLINLTKY